jgi:predicted Zn finger-like uncharacterized protein
MTLIVDCPACTRKLRVPDDLLGMKVKCPSCMTMFTASESPAPEPAAVPPAPSAPAPSAPASSEPAASAPAPAPASPSDEPASAPSSATSSLASNKICPGCRESIPIEARRCRHCGETFGSEDDADDQRPGRRFGQGVRRDSEPHRGTMVLVFGILSIVLGMMWFLSPIALPMGIAAWIMGNKDLQKMRNNQMDPQGMGTTQAGWICGIIGTIISGLFSMCCVGYFGFIVWAVNQTPKPMAAPPPPRQPAPRNFRVPFDGVPLRLPDYFGRR